MVRDLDLIKNILIKDFSSFQDNDMDVTHDELFAKNPFILKGNAWKAARACAFVYPEQVQAALPSYATSRPAAARVLDLKRTGSHLRCKDGKDKYISLL